MTNTVLPCVEVRTGDQPTASVIWLHGLGANGHDFEPIIPHLGIPKDLAIRFVFPHAPTMPVTLNGGMPCPAWFDILGLDRMGPQDEAGIKRSRGYVEALIEQENARGVPTEKIVLAGFSQGGAIALYSGTRHPEKLAGIMGLSTYLPVDSKTDTERNAINNDTPILMAHGTMDPVLPISLGETSRDVLLGLNYGVEWHSYPMEHQVVMEEIELIGRRLVEWLS